MVRSIYAGWLNEFSLKGQGKQTHLIGQFTPLNCDIITEPSNKLGMPGKLAAVGKFVSLPFQSPQ
jgi:hypothetical protein